MSDLTDRADAANWSVVFLISRNGPLVTTFGGAVSMRAAKRLASRPVSKAAARPLTCGDWILTRRVASSGQLELFRARAEGEIGPGCYLIKRALTPGQGIAEQMLAREAVVTKEVNSAHLSSVLAQGRCEGGRFHVLPFLDGVTVAQLMVARPGMRLGLGQALCVARQVASALAGLHTAEWLHGQVEPGHVLVSPQRQATLINLTGARRLGSGECDIKDWPRCRWPYLGPEAFSNAWRLTAALDVYALGVLLYEALAGRPPFAKASNRALIHAHRRERPEDLRRWRSDVSLEISELISRMLMKEAMRRPSAAEVARWLVELEIAEFLR